MSCPEQARPGEFSSSRSRRLSYKSLLRQHLSAEVAVLVVILVVDKSETVGEAESTADRRQERCQGVGADLDGVVGPQVKVGLLARPDFGQIHAQKQFPIL